MEEYDNTLPPIPSGEELEAQIAAANRLDLSKNWLDYTQSFPEPRYLLEYAGVPFAPLGGIQAITGHQKNGKTFLMAQFMAAVLSNGSERMRAHLPTLQINQDTAESLQRKPVVLYVDTEMEMLNTVKVVRRVQYLCGWDFEVSNPQLRVLWLRAEESNEIRWLKTKQAIEEVQPTAVFLDGIRDVIGDFNDNEQSATLISECMSMATRLGCCIFSVLHENPGSEKMRGHLGTELSNKVTDTFRCTKKKYDNGTVTFTVKQVDARGKDVDDWKFEIIRDAGNIGIPRILSQEQAAAVPEDDKLKMELTPEELANIAKVMHKIISPPSSVSYTTLRDGLKKEMHIGSRKATDFINEAEKKNVLIKQNGRYLYNMSMAEQIENALPF